MNKENMLEVIEEVRWIFSNPLRINIVLLLHIHNELSLNDLTNITNKSKSALSRQMKYLVTLDFIESFEKQESHPGIQPKFFRITDSFKNQFNYFDPATLSTLNETQKDEQLKRYIIYLISMNTLTRNLTQLGDKFIGNITEMVLNQKYDEFKEEKGKMIDMGIIFIPESSIDEFKELTLDYVNKILNLKKGKTDEIKPFMATIMLHPIMELLQK